jgi:hypothetical protein
LLQGEVVSRAYVTPARLERLERSLSERDRVVVETVARLRLATGEQLGRLHYTDTTPRQRRRALTRLVERRVLSILDRRVGGVRAGSDGFVFALDITGAHLARTTAANARRRIQRPVTPGALFTRHVLAVSELHVRLVEAERAGLGELLASDTEPACWRSFAGRGGGRVALKPDAYVRLGSGAFEDSWFVEVDLGTESSATLDRKLDTYRTYWRSGREQERHGVFPRVLWLVPNERRSAVVSEACARQPAEAWPLFVVTLYDDAVGLLTGATL